MDGSAGKFQDVGRLLYRKTLVIPQGDHLAQPVGQGEDGPGYRIVLPLERLGRFRQVLHAT